MKKTHKTALSSKLLITSAILLIVLSFISFYFSFRPLPTALSSIELLPLISRVAPPSTYLFHPSLQDIINPTPLPATVSGNRLVTFVATGDVMLGRSINTHSVSINDYQWYFSSTKDFLSQADLSLINLESPLLDPCPLTDTGMVFCGTTKNLQGLRAAGIDLANLANNHIGNFGRSGFDSTFSLLKSVGISPLGVTNPIYRTVRSQKFAFVAYTDIPTGPFVAKAEGDKIRLDIQEAKHFADIVIMTIHFGNEYQAQPSSRQKEIAHLAINAGADVVIGHHPHWVQPIEIYKGKLIFYSLGNFVFDQFWSKNTQEGLAIKLSFFDSKLVNFDLYPVKLSNYGRPDFMTGTEKVNSLRSIYDASHLLQ